MPKTLTVNQPLAYLMCRSCMTGVEATDTGHPARSVGYCTSCQLLTDDDRCWNCGRFAKTLRAEHGFCPDCLLEHDADPMKAALELWPDCVTCEFCSECPVEGDLTVLRREVAERCQADPCKWKEAATCSLNSRTIPNINMDAFPRGLSRRSPPQGAHRKERHPVMTIEKETATTAEDLHPYRPEMIKRMTQHYMCCVAWSVAAGSCDKSNMADQGKGGGPARPDGGFESGSAQKLDYHMAWKRLNWLEQRTLTVVIEREAVDKIGGDPGGYDANERWTTGTDGLDLRDRELFWKAFGGQVGNYHWSTLVEVEEAAYTRMARSLGWRPPIQDPS